MRFLEHFSQITDPRSHINRCHDLMDVLFLTVCAVLSGAEGWKDIEMFGRNKLSWLRRFRPFQNGIPVDDTIARIIRALDPDKLTECFVSYVNELRQQHGHQLIAIDGKTLRHSFEGNTTNALHAITVYLEQQSLIFCSVPSQGKRNEITTVQSLIESLELHDTTVTLDAMHCQKKTATHLRKKGAHYILCVKDNQKALHEELQWWFEGFKDSWPPQADTFRETDAGHGRVEIRTLTQLPVHPQLEQLAKWPGVRSIIQVKRERIIKDQRSCETLYYISSHEPGQAEWLAHTIRAHWQVENKAHWVLDVVYREDDCRIRKGNGAFNFAIIRRLCMNLARLHPSKESMRGKQKRAAWNDSFRDELIMGTSGS